MPFATGQIAQSNYVVYDDSLVHIPRQPHCPMRRQVTIDSANANLPSTSDYDPISCLRALAAELLGLETPHSMFADGHVAPGGPYDGIVTLNSMEPFQFTRPTSSCNFDAQTFTEHEMDEMLGSGIVSGQLPAEHRIFGRRTCLVGRLPGHRSHLAIGVRYFSIDNGITNIVNFSQSLRRLTTGIGRVSPARNRIRTSRTPSVARVNSPM